MVGPGLVIAGTESDESSRPGVWIGSVDPTGRVSDPGVAGSRSGDWYRQVTRTGRAGLV